MKHYAQMIYMLSQCKDANPAALFVRIMQRELRELKNLNFGGYSRRVIIRILFTGKTLAPSSSSCSLPDLYILMPECMHVVCKWLR